MTPTSTVSSQTSFKDYLPEGVRWRCRWLKFYARKTRWGVEAVRNVLLDWKYGGYCGGRIPTRFSETGAHATASTYYFHIRTLFGPQGVRVYPNDVLVDVGCGKGRVLNYWLHTGLKNHLYGLELDPEVAGLTANRLAKFKNVTIIAGDGIENLPDDATLIFLYNPFEGHVLEALKQRLKQKYGHRLHTIRILYYSSKFVDVFLSDPEWSVQSLDHLKPYMATALITPKLAEDLG